MNTRLAPCSLLYILVWCCCGMTIAQEGVSSFSVGVMRSGMMPPSSDIRIEELINYHRHQLPLPELGERVRLDLDWAQPGDGKSVLQVGLTTPREFDQEMMPPLNLVLVIDRSGSMAGAKIEHVRDALLKLTKNLRPTDQVSIISFSDEACIDLESCQSTEIDKVRQSIHGIEAGGYTNVHSGLMLGYQQAKKHFLENGSNRVILLSDGVANRGVTDAKEIQADSRKYNRQDIDLTTIGLGHDYNPELLRALADAGRGAAHFVGDARDIQKTFIEEVKGLLAPAARNVRLVLDFGESACRPRFFGYDHINKGTRYIFKLENLSYSSTQVVVVEFDSQARFEVNATLKFDDAVDHEAKKLTDRCLVGGKNNAVSNCEITRNYAIAKISRAIKVAARHCEKQKFVKAKKVLQSAIRYARGLDLEQDADVQRVVKIARKHRKNIAPK